LKKSATTRAHYLGNEKTCFVATTALAGSSIVGQNVPVFAPRKKSQLKKPWSEEPSDESREAELQQLRARSEKAEGQQGDSIAKWLELATQLLGLDKNIENK